MKKLYGINCNGRRYMTFAARSESEAWNIFRKSEAALAKELEAVGGSYIPPEQVTLVITNHT